jgi:membrane fusion protein, multidrug efflux system
MRKLAFILVILLVAGLGAAVYYRSAAGASGSGQDAVQGGASAARGGGGPGGGPAGGMARPPLPVELAAASRADVTSTLTVLGNLIGAATIEAVPKVGGRLGEVFVRLGDHVSRGQPVAKIQDAEIIEQVKQAEAASALAEATVRQREGDLRFATANLARSQNLFDRQLLSKQSLDDADARYQSALTQLDLARAQHEQNKSRLQELRINLANTLIVSPVDGFVGKRNLDPGAWVTTNSSFISVVDIGIVRLVANVAEKDLQRITRGIEAEVRVDAYPDEVFHGRVTRVAPVLDPGMRTAQMEVEIPNHDYRLKPGMYARVRFTTERHQQALVVPTSAVVNLQGKSGVFLPEGGNLARFRVVSTGIVEGDRSEITKGLQEGARVITIGAGALQDGDRVVLVGQGQERIGAGGPGRPGRSTSGGQTSGTQPQTGGQRAQ